MGLSGTINAIRQQQQRVVRRPGLAAGVGGDWSPAANFNIFNVPAPIIITGIWGHVTAVFAGANATPLPSLTPTGGVANALSVIAVAAAFPLNSILTWDGSRTAVSGVLRASVALGHTQSVDSVGTAATAEGWTSPMFCIGGIISIVNGGAADATGTVDWYISYIPCTPASVVTAL